MPYRAILFHLLVVSLPCVGAPGAELAAIMREYNTGAGIRGAQSDLIRRQRVERIAGFAERVLKLARSHPRDAESANILRQAIQLVGSTDSAALVAWETSESEFPRGASDSWVEEIVNQLRANHNQGSDLAGVIDRARYGYRPGFEAFFQLVRSENPDRKNRALATLAYAQYLLDKARMLEVLADRPEFTRAYDFIFGGKYLAHWRARGAKKLEAEAGRLFEAAARFEDVEASAGKVAEIAQRALYEIRHLGVGKPAPPTEGLDQDGVRFRLADYRGKVVLLYFWVQFCPT